MPQTLFFACAEAIQAVCQPPRGSQLAYADLAATPLGSKREGYDLFKQYAAAEQAAAEEEEAGHVMRGVKPEGPQHRTPLQRLMGGERQGISLSCEFPFCCLPFNCVRSIVFQSFFAPQLLFLGRWLLLVLLLLRVILARGTVSSPPSLVIKPAFLQLHVADFTHPNHGVLLLLLLFSATAAAETQDVEESTACVVVTLVMLARGTVSIPPAVIKDVASFKTAMTHVSDSKPSS